jgi:hypothetical protein
MAAHAAANDTWPIKRFRLFMIAPLPHSEGRGAGRIISTAV